MAKIVLDVSEVSTGWTFVRAELTPDTMMVTVIDDLGRLRTEAIGDKEWIAGLSKANFSGLNPSLGAVVLQKLVDDGHFTGVVA